ncbi:hypothetical protein [Saccharicrinis sp. FJH54]|uniref:hypothetical protein n=1 Tax=Saccharicrinis sp. FJH54 TaxID=3344665 RepID=UPI0035D40A38
MFSRIKKLKPTVPAKIGLSIFLYFFIIMILNVLTFSNIWIDFLSPYPQPPGHITGDLFVYIIGLLYILLGIAGMLVFFITERNAPFVLQLFLFFTGLTGLITIFDIKSAVGNQLMFKVMDLVWALLSIAGVVLLQWDNGRKKQIKP